MNANDVAYEMGKATALIMTGMPPGVINFAPIGSATYMPAEEVNDVDFAVLVKGPSALIYAQEFKHDQNAVVMCAEYDTNHEWCAVRVGNINLMICVDPKFFQGYLTATEVCKVLRLKTKAERIAVCMVVRDGLNANDAAIGAGL